jgi:metal-sulfur cluster biosynthetic enzyme
LQKTKYIGGTVDKKDIIKVLDQVYDPDYVNRSVFDMGLVTEDDITITDNEVKVIYTLTASICPFSAAIGLMIKYALEKSLKVPVTVSLKAGHYQEKAVTEILQDAKRSEELMHQLREFDILKRCVRLKE